VVTITGKMQPRHLEDMKRDPLWVRNDSIILWFFNKMDTLSMIDIANKFITNEHRLSYFGKFTN